MEGARQKGKAEELDKLLKSAATSNIKPRRCADWIGGYGEFTAGFPSPKVFKLWGAIATIAMAMERKTSIKTNIGQLFPNLYIIAIAPPGVGKTLITGTTQEFIMELPEHHLAPSSVSRASLVDALVLAERKVVQPQATPPVLSFNSLAVVQNEMGVFLPAYDTEFMAVLTDLYDCRNFSEKKRGNDINNKLTAPQLNMFAATTVSYMADTMPEGAWDQGFLSRSILVYSGEVIKRSLWDTIDKSDTLRNDLVHDLKQIGSMNGRFLFEPEAAGAIDAWHQAGGPPTPDHPKLQHYNSRRTTHLLKLCMVASASRGNDFIITTEDYHRALDWLLEAEMYMPDIFKSMAVGGDPKVIEETYYWAYKKYSKKQDDIPEAEVIEFLQNKVPAHSVERIYSLMIKSKLFEKRLDGIRPRAKKDV
jgi:hypothetical protein